LLSPAPPVCDQLLHPSLKSHQPLIRLDQIYMGTFSQTVRLIGLWLFLTNDKFIGSDIQSTINPSSDTRLLLHKRLKTVESSPTIDSVSHDRARTISGSATDAG
jgi:hypothetical protein